MVSKYYAVDRTDHRHVLRPNTIMSEIDELNEWLSDVDPQKIEAIQHTQEGTYSLVSTATDEWITMDINDTMEITQ